MEADLPSRTRQMQTTAGLPVELWQLLAALTLLLCAAATAAAERTSHSRDYQLQSFERVYLNGNAQLHLVQGQPVPMTATGSVRSLDRLAFETADGALYIDAGEGQGAQPLVIHLAVEQLKEVVSEGGGQVLADGLTVHALALEGRGSGRFDLQGLDVGDLIVVGEGSTQFQVSGVAENQFVDLAGVGRYQAQQLASQTSQVSVRGAGMVDLWVEEVLDVNVFGSARVRYSGTPWVLQQISGSGAIDRLR